MRRYNPDGHASWVGGWVQVDVYLSVCVGWCQEWVGQQWQDGQWLQGRVVRAEECNWEIVRPPENSELGEPSSGHANLDEPQVGRRGSAALAPSLNEEVDEMILKSG